MNKLISLILGSQVSEIFYIHIVNSVQHVCKNICHTLTHIIFMIIDEAVITDCILYSLGMRINISLKKRCQWSIKLQKIF